MFAETGCSSQNHRRKQFTLRRCAPKHCRLKALTYYRAGNASTRLTPSKEKAVFLVISGGIGKFAEAQVTAIQAKTF